MLAEYLEHLLSPCPRRWREMGYLREQIAINARFRRNRRAWQPHLRACRESIFRAAELCQAHDEVLIVGGGLHHDLPLRELSMRFRRVVLADLIHRPFARLRVRLLSSRVQCIEFDVTGMLARLPHASGALDAGRLMRAILSSEPGLPKEVKGEPDLVVSANVCGQLMLQPLDWLETRGCSFTEEEGRGLQEASAMAHLAWLDRREGARLLLSEFQRLKLSEDGSLLEQSPVPGLQSLPPPGRSWHWHLAPIPEYDRHYHVHHEVGAWFWRPGEAGTCPA